MEEDADTIAQCTEAEAAAVSPHHDVTAGAPLEGDTPKHRV